MNSKIVGIENDFFSQMVVDAIMAVKTFDDYGNATCARKPLSALCPPLRPSALPFARPTSRAHAAAAASCRRRYPLKAINVLKAHGKSAKESALLDGYALNMGRAAQGMVQSVKGAKIACLDVNLQKTKMQFGVQAS